MDSIQSIARSNELFEKTNQGEKDEKGALIDSYGANNDGAITDFIKLVEDIH